MIACRQEDRKPIAGGMLKCRRCGDVAAPKHHRACGVQIVPPPLLGTGDELKLLFQQLGINQTRGCPCARLIRLMNGWGPDRCVRKREKIIGRTKRYYDTLPWLERVAIKARGGILAAFGTFWPNPLDPLGSLVDEAIRRARVKAAAKP